MPGALAMSGDYIVYVSAISNRKEVIPLKDIAEYRLEDTSQTDYRRAHKYRNAKVLVIKTIKGELNLFVTASDKAPEWEKSFLALRSDF
jgi:phage gp36-like protein